MFKRLDLLRHTLQPVFSPWCAELAIVWAILHNVAHQTNVAFFQHASAVVGLVLTILFSWRATLGMHQIVLVLLGVKNHFPQTQPTQPKLPSLDSSEDC